jgi:hypothetical protein
MNSRSLDRVFSLVIARFTERSALLAIVALAASSSISCGGREGGDGERVRRAIAGISVGATADDVRRLAGEPDEVRREGDKLPWIVGAAEEWAYGVMGASGGFAAAGVVLLDEQGRVMLVRLPDRSESLRAAADRIPESKGALAAPSGMVCRLDRVRPDEGGVAARVTLVNRGQEAFRFSHDHTGIGGNLVVELFDARGRLLCRSDMLTLHSPYESDPAAWPVLVVEPGESASEDVRLGWRWREFGVLPAGTYRVRVAFPFEEDAFYPSNTVELELTEALR